MAAKRFAAVLLTANISENCMTAKNNVDTTVNINISNQNSFPTDITIWYSAEKDDPNLLDPSEVMMFDQAFNGYKHICLPGVAVEAGYSIWAQAGSDAVSIVIYGYEEVIS
jgi:hypothetical protein